MKIQIYFGVFRQNAKRAHGVATAARFSIFLYSAALFRKARHAPAGAVWVRIKLFSMKKTKIKMIYFWFGVVNCQIRRKSRQITFGSPEKLKQAERSTFGSTLP
ncbi:MAG: hypothetical protein FWC02_00750 [Firmicutes bacterium]|nr:hypothetical protein [Bacillota bacterium]MCL2247415.1 hypothetical protein [Lentimicrobiaceae bacterium]